MFAIYWPVMALVASVVLVLAIVVLSSFGLCKGFGIRMDPLPERDLNTYLPEDVSTYSCIYSNLKIKGHMKPLLRHYYAGRASLLSDVMMQQLLHQYFSIYCTNRALILFQKILMLLFRNERFVLDEMTYSEGFFVFQKYG